MAAPTYALRTGTTGGGTYLETARAVAAWTCAHGGEALGDVLDRYARQRASAGEAHRTEAEHLLEALALGVLWRAHGVEATTLPPALAAFVRGVAARRRAGEPRRRDGSPALLHSLDLPFQVGGPAPSLSELDALFAWLVATGEYDDEARQLEGWRRFLASVGDGEALLASVIGFAAAFERRAALDLGRFTAGVERFLRVVLPRRRWREDTVQCARRPSEYHLSMVGADILNRAWRAAFLARPRHVVVLPACLRAVPGSECRAERRAHDLRCARCTRGCALAGAAMVAEAAGAEAVGVVHGSDLDAFLRSPAVAGREVGIVGVACAPGLLGAGWRAAAAGLPAQCVLLDASGCQHWLLRPAPTRLDLRELRRIVRRG